MPLELRGAVGLFFVATCVLAASGCARSSPPEGAAAAAERPGPIRVATSGDYAPFSLWPETEPEPRGFSADVARAFGYLATAEATTGAVVPIDGGNAAAFPR